MSATTNPLERETEAVRLVGDRVPTALSCYFGWKTILDRVFALLLLVPGLPIIGLLVVLVRLTSRGPGIYSQVRTGKGGQTYVMYKIRSMTSDAETGTGAVWTQQNDPRVTRIGWLLRKLHLDELPQLFNVLRGEMSLIGPRPERPEFVAVLSEAIPGYAERLTMLPGITGLAQINLPPDTDLDSVRRKQVLDMQYIREASLWLDIRMLLCTFLRLFGLSGELAMRVMRLKRHVRLSDAGGAAPVVAQRPATPDRVLQEIELKSVNGTSRNQVDRQAHEQVDRQAHEEGNASASDYSFARVTDGAAERRMARRYPR